MGVLFQQLAHVVEAAPGMFIRRLVRIAQEGIRRWSKDRLEQQRGVGRPIKGDIGDRQRAEGFAVVAAGQGDEAATIGPALVAPVVIAHLEGDFDRARPVVGIEHARQSGWRHAHELLGQGDRRFMRHAGQHHMVEAVELVLQRGNDARMAVAEDVGPPGTDRIEIARAIRRIQPGAFGLRDGQHRHGFVIVHLRARVPDHGKIARGQRVGIGSRGVGHGFAMIGVQYPLAQAVAHALSE
jgi:hypothetical protein